MARSKSAPSAAAVSPWKGAALLVVLGAALYANALGGPLLLDDQRSVRENTTIQNLADLGQVLHPPAQSPMTGRPVPNFTLAVNYAMGGDAVTPYRVTNILIHILAGLALFGWLRRTLPRMLAPTGSEAASAPDATATGLALAVSAVWLAHPLNTETVDYLTQRTESLMSLFVLTALWASARSLGGTRRGLWEGVAIASAFLAVGSKESALVLPLLLVLWDRAFAYASLADAWPARKRLYLGVLASWLLFAAFARELPFFVERGFEEHVSRLDYFLHQGPIILRYLGLTVWPQNMVFDYGAPEALVLREALPGVAAVALLGVATLVALARWPRVGFWGAWFFITLAPASSLIPIPTEVAAERRMYLPLIALLVLAAWAVRAGLARLASPGARTRVAWGLTAVLVLALGAATVARNQDYQNALHLWETSLDRWPQPRAHEHISMAYRDLGRLDDSLRHLRIAAPDSPNARHALASLLLERGQVREAITEFREYIRLRPNDPHILIGREELAVALLQVKDFAGAAEQFRLVAQATPGYARARIGLAEALVGMNRPVEAMAAYQEVTRLQPDNAVAFVNLALLQRASGDMAGATANLRASLKLAPGDVAARQALIQILLGAKDFAGAETETRALLTLTPNEAGAYNVLGITLASQGRTAPAREAFEHALAVDPAFAEARQNLARLR